MQKRPSKREERGKMSEDLDLEKIVKPLLKWYEANKRILPWREEPLPYRVWVSEIMLQQTRVEAVKPYYERFMKALPTIRELARCDEEVLLKLWEGLGYYNRVRNLQSAALTVIREYNGKLPEDYQKLLQLKGIGSYTAGAIASIAFQIPVPAVDGNVLRVMTRLTGDFSDIRKPSVKAKLEAILSEIMPQKNPGAFNQALMELGATVCLPNGAPLCEHCPWHPFCEARIQDIWMKLPVKSKMKPKRIEKKTIILIKNQNKIVLHKRPKTGLLSGMYEYPNLPGHLTEEEVLLWLKKKKLPSLRIHKIESARHIFSHVEWDMIGYLAYMDELAKDFSGFLFVDVNEAGAAYPIPSAFSAYREYIEKNR